MSGENRRSVHRACHLCEAICGVRIDVEGDRIVRIAGDEAQPFSQGYICPKATALQDIHEDPDRLRRPMKRVGSEWVEISWDEALDLAAERLVAVQQTYGGNALGVYLGNPSVHNWGMVTHGPHLYKLLKTRNRFSATSVDQLPHQLMCHWMYGHQVQVPVPDIDRTQLLVIIGGNPMASNGSLWTVPGFRHRVKALQARGGQLVVIDPRRSETADIADRHHFIRPGTDAALLLAMLQVIGAEGLANTGHLAPHLDAFSEALAAVADFTPEWAAPLTGIAAADIRTLARQIAGTRQAVVYGRMGISVQAFGTLCQWAVQMLNIATGHLDTEGGSMFNSPAIDPVWGHGSKPGHFNVWRTRVRGLPEFGGEMPVAALAEEILTPGDGQIRALITGAGNPVLSTPNGRQLDDALAGLDFMVSIDIYLNETTRHAHLILPPTSPLEHDHYDIALLPFAARNFAQYSPPVFDKPDGSLHDWEIFTALGKRVAALTGAKPLPDMTPAQILAMGLAAGPYAASGLSFNRLVESVHGVDLGPLKPQFPERLYHPDKRIRCLPEALVPEFQRVRESLALPGDGELLLIGRRHVRSNNSWLHNSQRLVKGPARHRLVMNPEDAARTGVSDGGRVTVTSRVGSIVVEVQVSDEVMPGVVSLPHGWGHDRAGIRAAIAQSHAGVSVNDITDEQFLDGISANVALNGVPVRVVAA
jgi:anaerobic selenocysteine-containing dehydrogenase